MKVVMQRGKADVVIWEKSSTDDWIDLWYVDTDWKTIAKYFLGVIPENESLSAQEVSKIIRIDSILNTICSKVWL